MTIYWPEIERDPHAEQEAMVLAMRSGVEYVDLPFLVIEQHILALIPRDIAASECVLPFREEGSSLVVIVGNPSNRELKDKLQFVLNRAIRFAVAPESYIKSVIETALPR